MGRQFSAFQYPVDDFRHITLAELMGGQVHRYADIAQPLFVPLVGLTAGAFQYQFADGGDQPGLLGQRNEIRRWQQAHGGMLPAYQGFHGVDAVTGQVHFRLVIDHEFVLENGLAQAGFQGQLFHRGHPHVAAIELEIVAATALGLVHRHVRLVDHALGFLGGVREHADADAGAEQQFVAVDHEGLLHGVDQFLAVLADGAFTTVIFQQQGKFVAAHPGKIFFTAGMLADALCGGLEQAVADFMPQGFVDRFETVQVDHQQRHLFPVQACQGQGFVQVFAELGAVGQAGESVVVGKELQLLFGFLAGGQVGHHAHITDHPFLFIAHGADLQPLREGLAIAAGFVDLAFPEAAFIQRSGNHLVGVAVGGGFMVIQHLFAQHHGFAVAGNLFEAGIHRQEAELVVENEDAFRGIVENGGGQSQLLLALAVFGDVPAGADHAQGAALV